jgi:hypothetical protein
MGLRHQRPLYREARYDDTDQTDPAAQQDPIAAELPVSGNARGFGDLKGLRATVNGVEMFRTDYLQDDLGRIKQITESVAGATNQVRKFEYDGAASLGGLRPVRNGHGRAAQLRWLQP